MTTQPKLSSCLLRAGLAAGAFFFVFHSPAAIAWGWFKSDGLSGNARVIDGDTLEIGGERIRLEGIDAPESAQQCRDKAGASWACGEAAIAALKNLTSGSDVTCERKGTDKYGRTLGICRAAETDINGAMIRSGYAWAFVKYSTTYAAEEAEARKAGIGIWQADNMPPWDFRAQRWTVAETGAPQGCAIKGNITNHGAIYHMPWSPWYGKVKIDEAKGERWFCSESDAIAAGWRPSQSQ